eukprot:g7509.t1
MTSIAELEKKLASIVGEDVYGTDTSTAGVETVGADEVKSNSSRGKSSTSVDHKDEDKEVSNSTTPKPKIYSKDYTERMYARGMETKEKLKQRRQSIPDGCTFQPTISRRSKRLGSVSGKASRNNGNAFERLYNNAEVTKHAIQKLRDDDILENCTFKPKINKTSAALIGRSNVNNTNSKDGNVAKPRRVSRFDRLYQDAAQSRAKLAKKKKEMDSEVLTFKPKITSRGSRSRSPGGKKRYEMLYNDGKKERIQRRQQEKDEQEISGCTFKPKINRKRSSSARRSRGSDENPKDVYVRLQEYGRRSNAKLKKKREAKEKAEIESLSAARLSSKSKTIKSSTKKLTVEELNRSIERLSLESVEKRNAKIKKREMELKKEEGFTFKPAIKPYRRPQSARRARPNEKPESKIWERLHRQSQDVWKRQERLKKVKVKNEVQECTFKPKVGKRSNAIVAKARRRGRSPSPAPAQKDLSTPKQNSSRKNVDLGVPIWERLSHDNRDVIREREELKRQKELDQCMSRKVSPTSSRSPGKRKPIWERLNEQRKDVAALDAIRNYTELQKCTFQPNTSSTKKSPSGSRPIWERLNERKNRAEVSAERERAKILQQNRKFIEKARGKSVSKSRANSIFDRLHSQRLGGVRGWHEDLGT